jgi:hypothetical protein
MVITKKIEMTADVAEHIRHLQWAPDGRSAVIVAQLDRPTYTAVNKVLAAVGGKWDKRAKAHIFPQDVREALGVAVDNGHVEVEVDGFFETPPAVIDRMLALVAVERTAGWGLDILEPSAGLGAIADVLRRHFPMATLDCVERNHARCAALEAKGHSVHCADFMKVAQRPVYDLVLMNPPFERGQDVDHIWHAFGMLKPGGRLVSVASAGVSFRSDKKTAALRELVTECGRMEPLSVGSFKESGTGVNTVLVVIDKE